MKSITITASKCPICSQAVPVTITENENYIIRPLKHSSYGVSALMVKLFEVKTDAGWLWNSLPRSKGKAGG